MKSFHSQKVLKYRGSLLICSQVPIVFFSWLPGSLLAIEIYGGNNLPGRRLSGTPKTEGSFFVCKTLLIAYLATYVSPAGLSVVCWSRVPAYASILAPMLILSLI